MAWRTPSRAEKSASPTGLALVGFARAFFLFALLRGLAGPGTRLMRLLRRAGLVRTGLRRCRTALSANWRRSHPLRFVTGRGSAAGWCRTGHWLRAGLFRHMPRLLRSARRRGAAGMLRTATRGLLWSPGRPGSRSILLRQIGCRRGGPAVLFRRLARRGTPLPGLALARRACLGLARLSRWFCRFLGRCWLVLLGRSRRRTAGPSLFLPRLLLGRLRRFPGCPLGRSCRPRRLALLGGRRLRRGRWRLVRL